GPGTGEWSPARRGVTRVLRAGRRVVAKAPVPTALRLEDRRFLEIACATSPDLHRRLDDLDVIVALEMDSARAAWSLARRSEHPVVVWGAKNARKALERYGRPLPDSAVVDAKTEFGDTLAATV